MSTDRKANAPGRTGPIAHELGKIRVGRLPTMNQDEYPGLSGWWVQLRIGEDGEEVLARVYGNTPEQAHSRATALAGQPGQALTQQTLDDVMAGIPARDAEIEALRKEIEALQAALAQPQRLIFPTMLRKMWSGSEVQAWLDEELAKLTKLSSQQVTDKTDAGQGYNDGFSDGVILALQLMTMHGDYNGTQYCELFNAAGPNQIVERAIREGMWEMSGLSQTPAAVERRAAIEAARKEPDQ